MRTRLREVGAEAVADYELIELTLFRALPRGDTKGLAKTLLKEFGSVAGVINAPEARLREFKGVGDAVVSEFRLMGAVSRAVLREVVESRPVLSSGEAVLNYARAHIAFSNVEHFHVLFLDKKNRLIRDEIQQTGTVDHTPVYPREVVRRAIELDATALILVHNHPSGDTTPSVADIAMTKTVIAVAKPLGIAVHDHVIVGRQGHASMKGLRLI
ncbi:MAG: DNA repair protein RadC [Pseudomonadota bacterium]